MRKTIAAGAVLAVAAVLLVAASPVLDLELESVGLLGAAVGAVVALVPDRSPAVRLAGYAAGFVAAWIGFYFRAGVMPDTAGGRAVTVGIVVVLCVAVTAAAMDRIPLWSTLLGAGSVAGAYEFTYAAAPPELMSTSVSTATTLLFTVAVGFLVGAFFAPGKDEVAAPAAKPERRSEADEPTTRIDDILEGSK